MDEALRQQTEPPPTPTSEPPRSEWTAPVIGGAKDTTSYAADAGIPADTAPSDDVAAPLDGPEPATLAEASAEPASATVVGAAVAAAAGGLLKGAPGADRATEVEPTAVEHDSDADQSTEAEQSTDAEQSMAKGVSPGTGDAVEVEELDEPVQRPDLDGAQSVPEESSVEAAFDEPAFEEPVVVESVLELSLIHI